MNTAGEPLVLGVYLGHDLGACLLRNGEIAACIEEERLNRVKHGRPDSVGRLWTQFSGKFGYFPWASLCYCLDSCQVGIDDLDLLVVGDTSSPDAVRSLVPIKDKTKVVFITHPDRAVHHYLHAISAFLGSPFSHAAVLVVDGDGDWNEDGYEAETGYYFSNREGAHHVVFKNRYKDYQIPRSGIGWMYEQVTLLLGFANPNALLADAGKTMGLSSYGRPRPELDTPWITYNGLILDFSGFRSWLRETGYDTRIRAFYDTQLRDDKSGLATQRAGPTQYAKDVAFKAQKELEAVMLHLAVEMHKKTRAAYLCLSGGVALNSVANALIVSQGPYKKVFIPPSAYDGGQAIGLAYQGHLMLTAKSGCMPMLANGRVRDDNNHGIRPITHAYYGRRYCHSEYRDLLVASGLAFTELPSDALLAASVAKELVAGAVVGWFQGGSEIGPRALGHRSILANPCKDTIKDHLNKNVKFREPFRPFAASVLAEHAREIFEIDADSPYMLLVAPVREIWRHKIPAIVHVDNTSRVQTIDAAIEPRYHAVVCAFHNLTGVPLILNTSFNVQSMPLVESPYDAVHCFLCTNIDVLYMDLFKVQRPSAAMLFPIRARGWNFLASRDVREHRLTLTARQNDGGGVVSVSVAEDWLAMCEMLDGRVSVELACHKGSKATRPDVSAFLDILKLLARRGAITFRVGKITFGLPVPEFYPWQVSKAS